MELFFELEIAYIVISIFILTVTAIVTTSGTMPKVAFSRGMISIGMFLSVMIGFHYNMTTNRMADVKESFNNGKVIICENKMRKTISQSVLIEKNLEWILDGDLFISDNHVRDFHTSRCIEFEGIAPEVPDSL